MSYHIGWWRAVTHVLGGSLMVGNRLINAESFSLYPINHMCHVCLPYHTRNHEPREALHALKKSARWLQALKRLIYLSQALVRSPSCSEFLERSMVLGLWFLYLIGRTFHCPIRSNGMVLEILLYLVYIYRDLNGTCHYYVIKCPFVSPRVIYDSWRSESRASLYCQVCIH